MGIDITAAAMHDGTSARPVQIPHASSRRERCTL